jgi:hypothetical protein
MGTQMVKLVVFFLTILICSFSCTKRIYLYFDSDPQGATVSREGEFVCKTPRRMVANYEDIDGRLRMPAYICRWISGATDSVEAEWINVTWGGSYSINFTRPEGYPNLEADIMYERNRIESDRLRIQKRQAELESERNRLESERNRIEEDRNQTEKQGLELEKEKHRQELMKAILNDSSSAE